jgi:hypothetical protein
MYPQKLTYEIPLNRNDYIRIDIDFSIDRNNPPEIQNIKQILDNTFQEISKQFIITQEA